MGGETFEKFSHKQWADSSEFGGFSVNRNTWLYLFLLFALRLARWKTEDESRMENI